MSDSHSTTHPTATHGVRECRAFMPFCNLCGWGSTHTHHHEDAVRFLQIHCESEQHRRASTPASASACDLNQTPGRDPNAPCSACGKPEREHTASVPTHQFSTTCDQCGGVFSSDSSNAIKVWLSGHACPYFPSRSLSEYARAVTQLAALVPPMVLRPTGRAIPDMTKREHVCEYQAEIRETAPRRRTPDEAAL